MKFESGRKSLMLKVSREVYLCVKMNKNARLFVSLDRYQNKGNLIFRSSNNTTL